MLHMGEQEVTIAMPHAKKLYVGDKFIGLIKGTNNDVEVDLTNWNFSMNEEGDVILTSYKGEIPENLNMPNV